MGLLREQHPQQDLVTLVFETEADVWAACGGHASRLPPNTWITLGDALGTAELLALDGDGAYQDHFANFVEDDQSVHESLKDAYLGSATSMESQLYAILKDGTEVRRTVNNFHVWAYKLNARKMIPLSMTSVLRLGGHDENCLQEHADKLVMTAMKDGYIDCSSGSVLQQLILQNRIPDANNTATKCLNVTNDINPPVIRNPLQDQAPGGREEAGDSDDPSVRDNQAAAAAAAAAAAPARGLFGDWRGRGGAQPQAAAAAAAAAPARGLFGDWGGRGGAQPQAAAAAGAPAAAAGAPAAAASVPAAAASAAAVARPEAAAAPHAEDEVDSIMISKLVNQFRRGKDKVLQNLTLGFGKRLGGERALLVVDAEYRRHFIALCRANYQLKQMTLGPGVMSDRRRRLSSQQQIRRESLHFFQVKNGTGTRISSQFLTR
jgi:hypothetical protein